MNEPLLDEDEQRLVASTWAFRACAERSALGRFRRLSGELHETGAPEPILALIQTAIDDEERHIGLCDALAHRFGWTREPLPPTPNHPIGPKGSSLADRLLYEMVAFCCVTESINAAMLLAVRNIVTVPAIRETVMAILRDEVNHSKVGWAYLQYARNQGAGGFLPATFPMMFHGAGVEEIYEPGTNARKSVRLKAYGELDFEARTTIFKASMRDIVLPGFERMGLDTRLAREWLSHFEPSLNTPPSTALPSV